MSGVLLRFANGSIRQSGPFNTLATSVGISSKIAINPYNQVAYLGTNSAGQSAIFSTNLGATRQVIAVGDQIDGKTVTGLNLFDGLMKNGQLVYLANLSDGQAHIVRTNRGYTQTALNDSPVTVPWSGVGYLRKAQGEFGGSAAGTISRFGCNLTSTANILSYFGHSVTPLELQNWLLARFNAAPEAEKGQFISPSNDFSESIITRFSQEQVAAGGGGSVVSWTPFSSTGPGSNFQRIVADLRSDRPVKLRVPSHTGANYKAGGHYIMVYGLADPTKADAALTKKLSGYWHCRKL